ncbi:MAG: IS3 family transposase [Clostridiales bacterium]|nr:IS3 family transposase [Clostridiales bacterium]
MTREVRNVIFRYVFAYYNNARIYTGNPFGLSPVKYREWLKVSINSPTA